MDFFYCWLKAHPLRGALGSAAALLLLITPGCGGCTHAGAVAIRAMPAPRPVEMAPPASAVTRQDKRIKQKRLHHEQESLKRKV